MHKCGNKPDYVLWEIQRQICLPNTFPSGHQQLLFMNKYSLWDLYHLDFVVVVSSVRNFLLNLFGQKYKINKCIRTQNLTDWSDGFKRLDLVLTLCHQNAVFLSISIFYFLGVNMADGSFQQFQALCILFHVSGRSKFAFPVVKAAASPYGTFVQIRKRYPFSRKFSKFVYDLAIIIIGIYIKHSQK